MEVVTEQTLTKVKLLDKPLDEYSDEELSLWLETFLRPARSAPRTKKPKAPAGTRPSGTKRTKPAPVDDNFDDL